MLIINKIILLIFVFSLFNFNLKAQFSSSDSSFYKKTTNNPVSYYLDKIGYQARIYNGNKYVGYPFFFKTGHPFYNTDKFVNGTIFYDKVLYNNALLQYNEEKGTVLLKNNSNTIQLITEKIGRFSLENNYFVRITNDSLNNSISKRNGIYNIIYNGKITVLKQEQKFINEDISNASVGIIRSIGKKDIYLIKKKNNYALINKKKDLLELFSENKKEISSFIKSEKLNFKTDKQAVIVKVAEYYDKFFNNL